ncbi:MAG: winged helix-turn-helix domain-containing protein [Conexivisphaerales archaeon]
MPFDTFDNLLWWMFVASRGGQMRMKILNYLLGSPANANRLAEELGINYRTVTHHLEILVQNGLVVAEGPKYGRVYFPSPLLLQGIKSYRNVVSLLNKGKEKKMSGVE